MKKYSLLIICLFAWLFSREVKAQKFVDFYKAGARLNQEQKWAQSVEYLDAALKVSNTDTKANNYNIRLSWEYQPLSFIYIVFNKREFQSTTRLDTRSQEDHLIAKISYLRQL
jgi:hypothetical protein